MSYLIRKLWSRAGYYRGFFRISRYPGKTRNGKTRAANPSRSVAGVKPGTIPRVGREYLKNYPNRIFLNLKIRSGLPSGRDRSSKNPENPDICKL